MPTTNPAATHSNQSLPLDAIDRAYFLMLIVLIAATAGIYFAIGTLAT